MLLRRVYDQGQLVGVRVLRSKPRQRFSTGLVQQGIAEGWLALDGGRIIIRAANGAYAYRILRGPGYYCCYCGASQPGSLEAQAHVATHVEAPTSPGWLRRIVGGNKPPAPPDPQNPSGYRRDDYYECVLEA